MIYDRILMGVGLMKPSMLFLTLSNTFSRQRHTVDVVLEEGRANKQDPQRMQDTWR